MAQVCVCKDDFWLVRSIGGEGAPQHAFCKTWGEVRTALCLLIYGGVADADNAQIDLYMASFANPDEWSGEGTRIDWAFEIDGIEITKLSRNAQLDIAESQL